MTFVNISKTARRLIYKIPIIGSDFARQNVARYISQARRARMKQVTCLKRKPETSQESRKKQWRGLGRVWFEVHESLKELPPVNLEYTRKWYGKYYKNIKFQAISFANDTTDSRRRQEEGYSMRQIAAKVPCGLSTVVRALKRFSETNFIADRGRSGRPRKTSLREDRLLLSNGKLNYSQVLKQWTLASNVSGCPRTVTGRLLEIGLKIITD
ncbi:hypothetical protein TNCV_4805101 [Trichonephila clavipes]|nr:hypothetical protein TNCV_4805101 [Trichonephila clavipes]